MGFIYGVQKVGFPLTISIRSQSPDLLCFDDLLSMTPCHLNVVSTSSYIPDWRFLLRRPADGLRLLTRMENAAWSCTCEQFLKNDLWRRKYLRSRDRPLRDKQMLALRQHVIAGCNFPPSQFQLHLQYMLPPLLPFQVPPPSPAPLPQCVQDALAHLSVHRVGAGWRERGTGMHKRPCVPCARPLPPLLRARASLCSWLRTW